jgi:hypothetical protein
MPVGQGSKLGSSEAEAIIFKRDIHVTHVLVEHLPPYT